MTAPPIVYVPNFLGPEHANIMLDHIWNHAPWAEGLDTVPRREWWLNWDRLPYTYGSGEHARTYVGHHPHETLEGVAIFGLIDMMRAEIGKAGLPNCCFVNGYENERQHLGWHADDSPEMSHSHPIAVVSLGAARELWIRPKNYSGEVPDVWRYLLEPGSMFLMLPGMQREWEHRIPKSPKPCGPRVSLTYRTLLQPGAA